MKGKCFVTASENTCLEFNLSRGCSVLCQLASVHKSLLSFDYSQMEKKYHLDWCGLSSALSLALSINVCFETTKHSSNYLNN